MHLVIAAACFLWHALVLRYNSFDRWKVIASRPVCDPIGNLPSSWV
jgi:hypothetical protein